jgi:HEAT repeat protein
VRPDEVDAALQQLAGGDDRGRAEAALRLGRLRAGRAVDALTGALGQDRSPAVREAAARGLGLIAAPSSLPALQHAAQADDDRDVRHSADFAAEVIRANLRPR